MKCRYSQKYRPIYQTYTNGTNTSGYGADVFEKNCKGKMYNFNTLKETTDNHHITLGRPALISCKDGDTKKEKYIVHQLIVLYLKNNVQCINHVIVLKVKIVKNVLKKNV